MDVQGVNVDLFIEQWIAHGANKVSLVNDMPYFAYELHGYYEFSKKTDDIKKKRLKDKVLQHIKDAPSLAVFLDMSVPVKSTVVASEFKNLNFGMAKSLLIIANAGKNLTKIPGMMIEFGEGKVNLFISQLLTAYRLSTQNKPGKLYDIRSDEAAVLFVLNMIDETVY